MNWYVDVLGLECMLVEEAEDCIIGAVLGHPAGIVIGLHLDRERANLLGAVGRVA